MWAVQFGDASLVCLCRGAWTQVAELPRLETNKPTASSTSPNATLGSLTGCVEWDAGSRCNQSAAQTAFVAVGRDGIRLTSGILASLRSGSAQALLFYHRASSLKLDSVPDTYQKAARRCKS